MFMMMRTICKIKQKSLGAKVVIALCKTIQEKSATVYYDNFFTSLELIHYLRNEYGIFSLGTIRSNRLRGCQEMLLFDKPLAKNSRGASHQVVCNEKKLAVVKWYDKTRVDVDCSQIVKQYNAHMGGVDLADMLVSLYRSNFKTKRWYMALFAQTLDICANNARLLYRRDCQNSKKPLALK
uniref:SFRICE_016683 n=1 Tax=Spodoptera frugiperda TaxID=7108 RepID=A0A2H1X0R7_SPOFR